MPLKRVMLVATWAVVIACVRGGRSGDGSQGTWNTDAIRATLDMVVAAHNDVSFRYVLENRTDTDYRIANESQIRIVERSKSTGGLMPKPAEHVSGEFPLWVPARRRVHFALVWTSGHEIDPARLDEFVRDLNVRSFVLFDKLNGYQIECSTSGLSPGKN